jgi:hypothetical protein
VKVWSHNEVGKRVFDSPSCAVGQLVGGFTDVKKLEPCCLSSSEGAGKEVEI